MAHDEQVIDILMGIKGDLGEIKANMANLIGKDGNNGRVGNLEDRVDAIESLRDQHKGRRNALAALWAGGVVIGDGVVQWLLHKR